MAALRKKRPQSLFWTTAKRREAREEKEAVDKIVREERTVPEKSADTIVCPSCGRELNRKIVEKNKYVCYECGAYFRVRTKNRIRMVADSGSFEPWFDDMKTENPLAFPEYEEKVREEIGRAHV